MGGQIATQGQQDQWVGNDSAEPSLKSSNSGTVSEAVIDCFLLETIIPSLPPPLPPQGRGVVSPYRRITISSAIFAIG